MVRTTRNRAFPLIIRSYASAAFSSGYGSFIDRTPAWTLNASGSVGSGPAPAAGSEADLTAWPPPNAEPVPVDDFYERFADHAVSVARRVVHQATGMRPQTMEQD